MLDKSVPYHEFWMIRPHTIPLLSVPLSDGFHFSSYQAGDEADWAAIETAVLEFDHEEDALRYFAKAFAPYPKELSQRMLFVENEVGEKVATCTAWWKLVNGERLPILHWLAVKPPFQGKGLAKALVAKTIELFTEMEPAQDSYLHTQTWSHDAVHLYEKFGFVISADNIDGQPNAAYVKAMAILNSK